MSPFNFLSRHADNATNNESLFIESLEPRMMLSSVQIFAAGQTGTETLELKINDVVEATFENVGGDVETRQFERLSFTTDRVLTADDIRVEFINDLYRASDGFDRNVIIDRIVVDGVTFQTESDYVYSTGVWRDGGVSDAGFLNTEELNINGSFFYSDVGGVAEPPTNTGTRLRIEAEGSTGDEQLEILVDGEVVKTFTVSTTQDSYFYTTRDDVSIEQIQLRFNNDLYDPAAGIDRNLIVEQIQVIDRDTGARDRFFTNSSSTFSTGTWRAGDGVVDGFGRGDTLHSDGYFQYGFATDSQNPTIDLSFGDDGFVAYPTFSGGSPVAVDSDGTIAALVETNSGFDVAFYDQAGATIGQVNIALFGRLQPRILSLDFATDGDVYVNANSTRTSQSLIYKISRDGQLNTAFNTTGRLLLPTNPTEITATLDGGFLAAGTENPGALLSSSSVTKYNADGTIDRSYGDNGSAVINVAGRSQGIELTSDGSAYVLFSDLTGSTRTVTKLNPDGQVDASFGSSGVASLPAVADDNQVVEVDSRDRVIIKSSFGDQSEITRLTATGQLDNSFGDSGTVSFDGRIGNIQIDSQDRILGSRSIVEGDGPVSEQIFTPILFRLSTNGNLDSSFAENGNFSFLSTGPNEINNQIIQHLSVGDDGAIYTSTNTGLRKFNLA
jgi:uncharacterized delta-60 repeat protein